MATEASLVEQPAERHVEEVTQPKGAEVVASGEGQKKMENLSPTSVPLTGSEEMTSENNREITSEEVKKEDAERAPDDVSEKIDASNEVICNQKHEESTAVSDPLANGTETSCAREITEIPKENKISNEFRKDGTEREDSEVVEAGEGAVLVSDIPEGPMETNPNIDSNNTVEVKDAQPNASLASPGQKIIEAGEGAILASMVHEGPMATDPNADTNKAGEGEMKNPEQTLTGQNEKTAVEKPEQTLPDEVSNKETVNAAVGSGENVKEEEKSETTDKASNEETVNSVMDSAENEKEIEKKSESADEASVEKTVTSVTDSGENKKQEVEQTDRELPLEEDAKEITETKTVDEAPKEEIPPAKQSKQSNNLISKVRHSMGKVKKAILGKSPSSKSRSTEEKKEINVK